ncbi:hypothetical protein [Frankia sp. AvcI1]|uniref:hypothetical protein n=1 Tax=Frankia sp. AvcI1 TaxID=573496 RepID=UPI0021183E29|nr:hypothetical protein [Frankia sp. AvcI1]
MNRRYLPALVWAVAAFVLLLISLVDPGGAWPMSTVATLVLTILTGALLTMWFLRHPDEAGTNSATSHPYAPDIPARPGEERITTDRMPSAVPDYAFVFCATVRWWSTDVPDRQTPGSFDPRTLACAAVVERARTITAQHEPLHTSLAARELEAALSVTQRDSTGRVTVMADRVELTLPAPDRERLERLAAVRKDEELWNQERSREENRRRYLAQDVLRTPGSAVVWWLARHEDDVAQAVADLRSLGTLSAVVNNEPLPAWFRSHLHETADAACPSESEGQPDGPGDAMRGDRSFEPPQSVGLTVTPRPDRPTETAHSIEALLLDAGVAPGDVRRPYLLKEIAAAFARNQAPAAADAIERHLYSPVEINLPHQTSTPEPSKNLISDPPGVTGGENTIPTVGPRSGPRLLSGTWSGVASADTTEPVAGGEHLLNGRPPDGTPPSGSHLGLASG